MPRFLTFLLLLQFTIGFGQVSERISKKATEALAFCKKNNMNTGFCFLVDMSIKSGKNRFYIYDFKTNTITKSGLVCHGMGKNSGEEKPVYSNESGSNCTSLGKKEFLIKLGKRIIKLREKKGWSQSELSRNCDKDRQSIERLENGKINPSAYYLKEVADGLGVAVDELLRF